MSNLKTAQGDDHPEAAGKHLLDAGALLAAGRPDGAGYLSGYVAECALKTLWLYEKGYPPGNPMPWGRKGHDLSYLQAQVASLASVASAKIARYLGIVTRGLIASPLTVWRPEMRYEAPHLTLSDALVWHQIAGAMYQETVAQMRLDGVL